MDFETILYEKKDGAAWITYNRPEVLNAQNNVLRSELKMAVEDAKIDDDVFAVVITGAGDKAFSAGADITMFTEWNSADVIKLFKEQRRAIEMLRWELLKPAIAMVNGLCLGGGCEVAMSCDIIVASEKAKFGQPETNVGVIPGGGGTQILPRLIGEKKARELVFTGDLITADQAYQMGLVNHVVPHDKLKETVEEILKKIKRKSPAVLKIAKIALNKSLDTPLSVGMEGEKDLFAMCFGLDDQKEGTKAFLEKRKPNYTGR